MNAFADDQMAVASRVGHLREAALATFAVLLSVMFLLLVAADQAHMVAKP